MTLSTVERVLFLRGAELFNQIASEDLMPVALVAQEAHFHAGEKLMRQGDPGDSLYVVVDGEASISLRGVGVVATRRSGSSIGEMGVISRQPRSADCVAVTEVTTLKIDRDDFWELLAEQPPLALGVIKALSRRLEEAVANLEKLGSRSGLG